MGSALVPVLSEVTQWITQAAVSVGNFIKLNLVTGEAKQPSTFPFWPLPFFMFAAVWAVFTFVLASRGGRKSGTRDAGA